MPFFIFRAILRYLQKVQPLNHTIMPIRRVPGGYQWGQTGKVYPTKAQAEAQARAIYTSGYREKPSQSKNK